MPIEASLKTALRVLSSLLSDNIFNASKRGSPVLIIEDNCLVATANVFVEGGFNLLFLLFFSFRF